MISSVNFLPHGMQIIPDLDTSGNPKFESINGSMDQIRQHFKIENPDLIFLFTPHGYHLDESYLVYQHQVYEGKYYEISPDSSVVHGECKFSKTWTGDADVSLKLVEHLRSSQIPVEGIIQGFPDYPLNLAWGETVPLYYLPEDTQAKIVIIGIPRSRHTKIVDIQVQLKRLMDSILEFLDPMERKISLIFSGDLSHTHIVDSPYGYHGSSKEFDDLVINWAKTQTNTNYSSMLKLQPTALACGMSGMSMINHLFSKIDLESEMIFYELPTYFGMMIARWKTSKGT